MEMKDQESKSQDEPHPPIYQIITKTRKEMEK
jgi:hypothetical protein